MFSSKREKITSFINIYWLYIRMKIDIVSDIDKIRWVLTYVQGGVAET